MLNQEDNNEAPSKSYKRKRTPDERRREKSKRDALKLMKGNFGNISLTCEKVGVSRQTFYRWRSEDADFEAEIQAIQERTLDFVESKMLQGINDGNARLIMFYLNSKGKKRGYGMRPEDLRNDHSVILNISAEENEF